MNKTTENIFKYCPELLIVAIGSVQGIYISEWHNVNKEKVINTFINKLENSQEGLKKSIKYDQLAKFSFNCIINTLSSEQISESYLQVSSFKKE